MKHLTRIANLLLLVAFPVAWGAPLMRAGLLPFFGMSEISVLSGIGVLWESDPWLASLVILLAIVAPYLKTLGLAGIQFGYLTDRFRPVIRFLGRLAFADIFLIALYVVIAKGVGVGRVEPAWGLWLFTGCVIASLMLSYLSPKAR
ncbi:paraquat-inducible protein A [Qingshengfaniella alkalisoli]|uniref:Paraquat-inducible membrane protein A n=1 Tax=Qingshengfaniella alkalisoli TaxID=2599296 RepID=A0A5B8IV91_9RHOB|nr:paraquat-inducible protein A [Qingshengfaniella alkalisoli]QDY68781.1 paraquat-inducible membrane protein A [Qingshengfaniella alkalisoli]